MSDDATNWAEAQSASMRPTAPLTQAQEAMHRAAAEVITIQDVTYGERSNPIRVRGQLKMPAEAAFDVLRPRFEAVGHTPMLRREDALDEIQALPTVFEKATGKFPTAAVVMLALTILTVFLTGVGQYDELYVAPYQAAIYNLFGYDALVNVETGGDEDAQSSLIVQYPELLPSPEVWRAALWTGVLYTLALLGILGAHEMGHYLMARRYGVHTTLPFFIPMPPQVSILGTMGAVIAMREPAPNRRIQFDIGIAGPLAGLIVALPVLFIGLQMSEVQTREEALARFPEPLVEQVQFMQEGNSLVYLAAKYLVFGEILPSGDRDVWIHPIAMAAWAGLLVTALNLMPIGQLDGGHVMYGLFGHKARAVYQPILIALVLLATIGTARDILLTIPPGQYPGLVAVLKLLAAIPLPGWSGWWIWVLLGIFLLRRHAPVLDEITGLDTKRKLLGVAMLVIFVLIFTPTPIVISPASAAILLRWLI